MRTSVHSADPRWVCNRKKAYPNAEFAKKVARNVNARDEAANLVAYVCDYCGRWHVGRQMAGS